MSIAANLALTAAGQALKAKIEEGKGTLPLDITRIVTASGTSDDPTHLTDVVGLKQQFIIANRSTENERTTIGASLNNSDLATGYPLSQIGFYANDPDDGEILYRITQFAEASYVPSKTERAWTYEPTFNIFTGNASEVIINIDLAGVATMQAVLNAIIQAKAYTDTQMEEAVADANKLEAVNVPAAGWEEVDGEYAINITIPGLGASDNITIFPANPETAEFIAESVKSWGYVSTNTITLFATALPSDNFLIKYSIHSDATATGAGVASVIGGSSGTTEDDTGGWLGVSYLGAMYLGA